MSETLTHADQEVAPFDEAAVYGDLLDPHSLFRDIAARGGAVQEGDPRQLTGLLPDLSMDSKTPYFLILGYDEVRQVLTDPATYSNDYFHGLLNTFGRVLMTMDPPEHTRYRRIFQKALLPHVVAKWSTVYIDPVIDALFGKFEHDGKCDLVPSFVKPYPFDIVYRQLDLPQESVRTLRHLAHAVNLFQTDPDAARAAGNQLRDFYGALVQQRRTGSGQDLVSVLSQAEVDGERLSDEIVVGFFRQILSAAGDTTYRATASMLIGLLRDRPDQLEAVLADRSLVGKAIEENLRWDGPEFLTGRAVKHDVELAGVKIPAGAVVHPIVGLANRDPQRFQDPDRFDIMRPNLNQHMGFLTGPHICVGQHLARLEMARALNLLLDRFPKLRLDPDYPPPANRGSVLRWTYHLHVRFD